MSIFEEYQVTELQELFDIETISHSVDTLDSLSRQEEAVLQFIVDNPTAQYVELQNTFKISDRRVISIVIEYGTPSEKYDEMKELKASVMDGEY